jgi:hypothetical protein
MSSDTCVLSVGELIVSKYESSPCAASSPRQIFLAATLPALFAPSAAVKLSQAEKSGRYYSVFLLLLISVWKRQLE